MALIHRQKPEQPPLMRVDADASLNASAPKVRRAPAVGVSYWPSVEIMPSAQTRLDHLEILHGSITRAVRETLCSLLESIRNGNTIADGAIRATPLMPSADVPNDVTFVYRATSERLTIVDIRRPDQPSLF